MTDETLVVVNPSAGGGRCAARTRPAIECLRGDGWKLRIIETREPREAIAIVEEAWAHGTRRFLAAGGDGTTWEVVMGMRQGQRSAGDKRPGWLGLLPAGTGNSFLRDFGILSVADSLRTLRAQDEQSIDLGRLEMANATVWSLNLVGIGFIADVCETANRRYKWMGPASYVAGVFQELAQLKPLHLSVGLDGAPPTPEACTFLALCNSRFTGGAMEMAPDARPEDGLVDIVRVAPFSRTRLLRTFPSIFRGKHVSAHGITVRRASHLSMTVPGPLPVMVDGEVFIDTPIAYHVEPGALRIAAPRPTRRHA